MGALAGEDGRVVTTDKSPSLFKALAPSTLVEIQCESLRHEISFLNFFSLISQHFTHKVFWSLNCVTYSTHVQYAVPL